MAIDELDLELPLVGRRTPEVEAFLTEAERRIDALFESGENRRIPLYLPSDSGQVYSAMAALSAEELPRGGIFCEWGSGFGIATCIAALLGHEAHGIEIEPVMVERARQLATDHRIDAQFHIGSYEPEGYESYEGVGGGELVRPQAQLLGADPDAPPLSYPGIDHPIEDIDLFFIYPRPGEQEMMHEFFDAIAGEGALMLCYYGQDDICAYRKVWDG